VALNERATEPNQSLHRPRRHDGLAVFNGFPAAAAGELVV
jgi:hypothetical protein